MKLSYIIAALEEYAPLSLQEKWDNSGLQIGLPADSDGECTGVLVCVDVTPAIIAEAVRRGCNLVVSHHPLIFKGLRSITGRTQAERTVAAAIRAGVAVYSSHTALDSTLGGISYEMARRLDAEPLRVLAPAEVPMARISVMCDRRSASDVRLILLDSPAGECASFDVESESINPSPDAGISESLLCHDALCRVEAVVPADKTRRLCTALADMPGGDSLRIDIVPLESRNDSTGLGLVATLSEPVDGKRFVELLKERFGCTAVKASLGFNPAMTIRRVAMCGGSGGEFIAAAAASGAQAYVTADIRYHDFADYASSPLAIFDIGHFESEACAKDIFYHIIQNKFPNFAVCYSEVETLPVQYL